MKNFSDEELVAKYISGDDSAFEELVERCLPLVYGLARKYCGDKDKAADIAQEAFVKAWRNMNKFDATRSFRSWLFVIAKNTALDWLKKKEEVKFSSFEKNGEEESFSESLIDTAPSAAAVAEKNLLSDKIRNIVEQLPENYREVVSMRVGEDLTFREISERLKKPLDTVKSRYFRALKVLKDIIKKEK